MLARFSLLVVLVLSAVTVACGSPRTDAPGNATGTPEGSGPHLPSAFTVSRIADFKEAAAVVGFDIPKSDLYPLHWGYLFIQPGAELGPSTSRKAKATYDLQQYSAEVTVGPLSFWPDGALREGDAATYGGRNGWISRYKYDLYFSTPFANSDRFGAIWMVVQAPREAEPLLESFVGSLKVPAP